MTKCPTCHGSAFHPDDEELPEEDRQGCPRSECLDGFVPDDDDRRTQSEESKRDLELE